MNMDGVAAAYLRIKRDRLIDTRVLVDDGVSVGINDADNRVEVVRRSSITRFGDDITVAGGEVHVKIDGGAAFAIAVSGEDRRFDQSRRGCVVGIVPLKH